MRVSVRGIYSKVNMVSAGLQAPELFMMVYCRYYLDAVSSFETDSVAAALPERAFDARRPVGGLSS
jgi:hypothetical protein